MDRRRSDCLLLPLSPPVSCKSFEPVLVKTISGTALTFRRLSSLPMDGFHLVGLPGSDYVVFCGESAATGC